MKKQVLIWGSGAIYNQHINLLRFMEQAQEFDIVGVVANLYTGVSTFDGWPMIYKSMVSATKYDCIIIMSDKFFEEIVAEAMAFGANREQILHYKILDIPYLEFNKYIALKSKQISIITNNCWGGMAYASLGMECLSPFKNLFLEDEDYIKLLLNLHDYLEMPLEFARYEIEKHSKERYPVMQLGDIFVHCNHDTNPEDALEKWNRRLKKINYDNLFVEMYTENKDIAERFVSMGQYKNKICFVPFETHCDNMLQLKLYPGQREFFEIVLNNSTFSLIDLLLGDIKMRIET